jgi:hypothetical protein
MHRFLTGSRDLEADSRPHTRNGVAVMPVMPVTLWRQLFSAHCGCVLTLMITMADRPLGRLVGTVRTLRTIAISPVGGIIVSRPGLLRV